MALIADWWPPSIATGNDGTLWSGQMEKQRQPDRDRERRERERYERGKRGGEIEREIERQTERQTERCSRTETHTHRHRDRHTYRNTDTQDISKKAKRPKMARRRCCCRVSIYLAGVCTEELDTENTPRYNTNHAGFALIDPICKTLTSALNCRGVESWTLARQPGKNTRSHSISSRPPPGILILLSTPFTLDGDSP